MPAERFLHAFVCSGQNVAAGAVGFEVFETGFQFGTNLQVPIVPPTSTGCPVNCKKREICSEGE